MSLQQPCLPINNRKRRKVDNNGDDNGSLSSFDPQVVVDLSFNDVVAMDASDYLAAVVSQASALPDYFVAAEPLGAANQQHARSNSQQKKKNPNRGTVTAKHHLVVEEPPIDGSAASMHYLMSHRTCLLPPPSPQYTPKNPSWVDQTLADFSELRSYLEQCRLQGIGGKKTQRIPLPSMKDRSGWHMFCVGQAEAEGNVGSYYDESDSNDGIDNDGDDETRGNDDVDNSDKKQSVEVGNKPTESKPLSWRDKLPATGFEPSVQLVLQLDQVLVRRVLSHLAFYVYEGWSPYSSQRAAWLYALLARLERPIHRDDAAMLYNLLKVLTQVRSQLELDNKNPVKERDSLARLNLLIIIIGIYLEQGDASVLL